MSIKFSTGNAQVDAEIASAFDDVAQKLGITQDQLGVLFTQRIREMVADKETTPLDRNNINKQLDFVLKPKNK